MNKLDTKKRAAIVAALVEGNSIRATCRLTGAAKGTVLKLLADLGAACEEFHDSTVREIKTRRVQADEIWCYVGCKAKNVPASRKHEPGLGDAWTWTALDADSKLCISWTVGDRTAASGRPFIEDIASRLANRVQLTTDGHKVYVDAVERAFGTEIDYAILQKHYGPGPEATTRYSPPVCTGVTRERACGSPDPAHVSTSYVERQNLTMRMHMRWFTRLSNAFCKKLENLRWSVAIHFVYYNFARVHQTLRVTPAMEAGLASRVWTLADLVGLLEAQEVAARNVISN